MDAILFAVIVVMGFWVIYSYRQELKDIQKRLKKLEDR